MGCGPLGFPTFQNSNRLQEPSTFENPGTPVFEPFSGAEPPKGNLHFPCETLSLALRSHLPLLESPRGVLSFHPDQREGLKMQEPAPQSQPGHHRPEASALAPPSAWGASLRPLEAASVSSAEAPSSRPVPGAPGTGPVQMTHGTTQASSRSTPGC